MFGRKRRTLKPPRVLCRSCPHECLTCDYFDSVFGLSLSARLRSDCAELKSEHVVACMTGHPNASSCRGAQ